MLDFLYRHAKAVSLIGGFLFAIVGGVWSFAVQDRLSNEARQLSDARANLTEQVRSLSAIASEYFIANQQGDLIFVTAGQDRARRDVAELIYKGNMLDRATPVRNMIGALAIAKVLDYSRTYGDYEKLNDAARANLSLDNFIALKRAEREIINKGQERIPVLIKAVFEIDKSASTNRQAQERNRLIGLIFSFIGSFLLLSANLIASRQK
jgi:hypothetical protein